MNNSFFANGGGHWSLKGPVLASSLCLNLLSLALPIAILQIFDRVIPFQSVDTLFFLTLLMISCAMFEFGLRWSRSVLLSISAQKDAVRNHHDFLDLALRTNTNAFQTKPAAVYMDRFAALGKLRDHYSGANRTLVIDLPFTLIFILAIAFIGGWLVLVPLISIVAVLAFTAILTAAQKPIFEQRKALDSQRYAFLESVFRQIATVKANTMERQLLRRFELLQDQSVQTSHRMIMFSGFSQSYGAVFGQFAVAAMGIFGAYLVIIEQIGIAELAACMLLNGRTIQPLLKLMGVWVQSESAASARGKLNEIVDLPKSYGEGTQAKHLQGAIEANDIGFDHPQHQKTLFENVSFLAKTGDFVLLDAEDGWSVRALQDMVLGQVEPSSGALLIDGHPAKEFTLNRGFEGIVAVESEPALFSGTLLDNISAFGGAEQVQRALDFAIKLGLEARVHRLPRGYNMVLGSNSIFEQDPVNRQLISLVRALALQPKVLILDEPTAVLDNNEREAFAAILAALKPRPTVLVSSPDPRLRRLANSTVTLTNSDLVPWDEDRALERLEAKQLRIGAA
ncbi:MAG: ABC transporter transmembrane domain-containing protein [Pseudomonadota bacterium]